MPAVRTVHSSGSGETGQVRPDGQVRFDPGENVRGGHQRFRPRYPHQAGEDPGESLDDTRHDAHVIENGDQGGEEDDRGKALKRQHESQRLHAVLADLSRPEGQPPEHKAGPLAGRVEELDHAVVDHEEHLGPGRDHEHEYRDEQLQADAPADHAPVDVPPVGGQGPRHAPPRMKIPAKLTRL